MINDSDHDPFRESSCIYLPLLLYLFEINGLQMIVVIPHYTWYRTNSVVAMYRIIHECKKIYVYVHTEFSIYFCEVP